VKFSVDIPLASEEEEGMKEKTYPLSERESWRYEFSSRALEGFLAHGGLSKFALAKFTAHDAAVTAVEVADALLARLEETGEA